MTKFNPFLVRCVIAFLMLLMTASSMASVTMIGSRIIYQGENKSVDVQLRNRNDFPYVVQTWFDDGDMATTPEQSTNVPFVATPPVFRIQPNSGQMVRVSFMGTEALPQDRESVFYFNFLQIPPANVNASNGDNSNNKMIIMLRNRVKLFYRPVGIDNNVSNFFSNIEVTSADSRQKAGITINNDQPYHVSLSDVRLSRNGVEFSAEAEMIPPFSSRTFYFDGAKPVKREVKDVTITLINDQGARLSEKYQV